MALKKACYCMSLRWGTIIFLCLFAIGNFGFLYSIRIVLLYSIRDLVMKGQIKKSGLNALDWADIFIRCIGTIVYLCALIAISRSLTPSISWLNSVIGFSLFHIIFHFFVMRFYTHYDLCKKASTGFCEEVLLLVWLLFVLEKSIIFYGVLVFHGYKTYLRENPTDTLAPRNVNDREANFSGPSANNLQNIAPQNSVQPPQYSAQTARCFVESDKK